MAYTLNTSHALYSNLVELIGVQSGALVSHKTARTFTKHADASYGTGAYGEHFTSVDGGYTVKGASFTPELVMDTSSNNKYSVFIVINARTTGGNCGLICKDNNSYSLCAPSFNGSNKAAVFQGYTLKFASSATVGTGAQTLCITHNESNGSTGNKLYLNGSFDSSGAPEYGNTNTGANYIGGYAGQGAVGASTVWIAIFDKELSAAEISDLHNSLGASNAFGLLAGGNAAPTFPGPAIGNQTGTVGTALSANNVSSKFADTDALTFTAIGSWPPGVTVSSAGVISGTPTTDGTYASLKVRATDTAAQTVDSDTFSFTISAAGTNASDPGGTGTSTGSGSGGTATGGGSGTFTFDACENNTHSGPMSGVAVNWAWHSGGAVGAASVITNGSGTITSGGMTITGLPSGPGYGILRSSDGTVVGYREGTVS